MRGFRLVGAWRLGLVAAACMFGSAQTAVAPPPADDTAYYVIGVFPADTTLDIVPGSLNDTGGFVPSTTNYVDPSHPNSGFIVGKIKGDAVLGLPQIRMTVERLYGTGLMSVLNREISRAQTDGIDPQDKFDACNGRKSLTFHVQAGHVLYITSLAFSRNATDSQTGSGFYALSHQAVTPYMLNHLDKARDFLKQNYPQLADRLEQGSYQMLPIKASCPVIP